MSPLGHRNFNCTGKFCYRHGNFQNTEEATGSVLKIQIKTYARVSFLIKLQGLGLRYFPVNFVNFLRIPFHKATVSEKMKAFKLQVKSYKFRETKDWLNPHYG